MSDRLFCLWRDRDERDRRSRIPLTPETRFFQLMDRARTTSRDTSDVEFATALVGEVFHRSFDNRKQLASYVGLTPTHFQTGEMCRDQVSARSSRGFGCGISPPAL
jgi:hypothetical protein